MENFIANLDAEKIALIVAIAYGVLSDVVGESEKTDAKSGFGFFMVCLKALAKNIPSARAKKK